MVRVSIFSNEIGAGGELVDRLAAVFEVRGQELTVVEGNGRWVQVGMPVYSERHGRLIDFDTDGEEWARNLPRAYRNGAVAAEAEEIVEKADTAHSAESAAAVALGQSRRAAAG